MSNNKQSMKLYTEKSIRCMIESMGRFTDEQVDYYIDELTPIELPSDEEIKKEMEKQRMFDFAKSFVYTWNYITKGNFESTKDMNKELENLFEETYGGVNK